VIHPGEYQETFYLSAGSLAEKDFLLDKYVELPLLCEKSKTL
jgi:hypothetical protein